MTNSHVLMQFPENSTMSPFNSEKTNGHHRCTVLLNTDTDTHTDTHTHTHTAERRDKHTIRREITHTHTHTRTWRTLPTAHTPSCRENTHTLTHTQTHIELQREETNTLSGEG